jgi:hypothetical protein
VWRSLRNLWAPVRNLWAPAHFHYARQLRRPERAGGLFEGWYLKVVDAARRRPWAFIPGVFLGEDAHAFVQALDGREGRSWYHRYPVERFVPAVDGFDVRVGRSRFHRGGLELDLDPGDAGGGPAIRGSIAFGTWRPWPVRIHSPGAMGPYGFTPLMQCYHGILSLDHALSGSLDVDGERTGYDGGRGYVEKDWGRSFPLGYVWAQSNHFDRPGTSVSASVATIPWVTGAFRGLLVGFLHEGRLHRFTTYTGARLDRLAVTDRELTLRVADRRHALELRARRTEGALLRAPYERAMLERVAETMTSEIDVRLLARGPDGDRVVYEGTGRAGCLEAQGRLDRIVEPGRPAWSRGGPTPPATDEGGMLRGPKGGPP